MGNTRNRARKRKRIPPSKQPKKPKLAKYGDPSVDARGPSGAEIGDQSAACSTDTENVDVTKQGTIFMDLALLFTVFEDILKCPECGCKINSHVDLKRNTGFSHYISLECRSSKCEWKYCFSTSMKKGQSFEVNARAAMAFRDMGKGHKAMTTFTKVMNIPPLPT